MFMAERIKILIDRLLEFWNQYNNKQKTIIVCVCAGILLTFVVLSYVLTRPTYIFFSQLQDAKVANSMVETLEPSAISSFAALSLRF